MNEEEERIAREAEEDFQEVQKMLLWATLWGILTVLGFGILCFSIGRGWITLG